MRQILAKLAMVGLISGCLVDSSRAAALVPQELTKEELMLLTEPNIEAYLNVDDLLGSINDDFATDHESFAQEAALFLQTMVDSIEATFEEPESSRGGEIRASQLKLMRTLCSTYGEAELCHDSVVSTRCAAIGSQLVLIEQSANVKLEYSSKYLAALMERVAICQEGRSNSLPPPLMSPSSSPKALPAKQIQSLKKKDCNWYDKILNWLSEY